MFVGLTAPQREVCVATVVTFVTHLCLICFTLDNQFLRYDDLKNFHNPYVDPIASNASIHTALYAIWLKPNESTVLAVWEPVSQSVKLLTNLFLGNSRHAHMFVSVIIFSITAGMMVSTAQWVSDEDTNTSDTSPL